MIKNERDITLPNGFMSGPLFKSDTSIGVRDCPTAVYTTFSQGNKGLADFQKIGFRSS